MIFILSILINLYLLGLVSGKDCEEDPLCILATEKEPYNKQVALNSCERLIKDGCTCEVCRHFSEKRMDAIEMNTTPSDLSEYKEYIISISPPSIEEQWGLMEVPITWDFETGNLVGWTKTGDAFDNQPTFRDNSSARKGESSNYQGDYWISTIANYEALNNDSISGGNNNYSSMGSLASRSFVIKGNLISFLFGGGPDCSVELIVGGETVLIAAGNNSESMNRVEWNVSAFKGMNSSIILKDEPSLPLGHINFDDVVFDEPPEIIE